MLFRWLAEALTAVGVMLHFTRPVGSSRCLMCTAHHHIFSVHFSTFVVVPPLCSAVEGCAVLPVCALKYYGNSGVLYATRWICRARSAVHMCLLLFECCAFIGQCKSCLLCVASVPVRDWGISTERAFPLFVQQVAALLLPQVPHVVCRTVQKQCKCQLLLACLTANI
jgi:hypothetical protein